MVTGLRQDESKSEGEPVLVDAGRYASSLCLVIGTKTPHIQQTLVGERSGTRRKKSAPKRMGKRNRARRTILYVFRLYVLVHCTVDLTSYATGFRMSPGTAVLTSFYYYIIIKKALPPPKKKRGHSFALRKT